MGVATPLLGCYAAKYYLESQGRSRDFLDRMLTVELLQNTVLCFVRAAHDGVPYHNLSDHRHYRDWGPNPGRLFRLPWAMYEQLAGRYHPFFFFHDSGHDAPRGLLALRRSLEFDWDRRASDAASYYWEDGTVRGLRSHLSPMTQGEMVPNRGFDVAMVVSSPATLKQCEEAYLRFLELTQRRFNLQGEMGRIQPSVEITRILNNEGYGLETSGISERLRRSLDPKERDWRCPTSTLTAAIPRLRAL